MEKKERPKVGVGVIVIRDGRLLVGKRKGSHGAGEWALPGGHLEYGESVEACAERELFEETNLKALSIRIAGWSNDVIEENKHYITFFTCADRFVGEPRLCESHKCEGWKWYPLNELPSPLFRPLKSLLDQGNFAPRLSLSLMQGSFGICHLDPFHSLPAWAQGGSLLSISKTPDELSIVCSEEQIPSGIIAERGWRGIKVEGPLDFSRTGILSSLSVPLAAAKISLFTISTYDTEYLLIKQEHLAQAIGILGAISAIRS